MKYNIHDQKHLYIQTYFQFKPYHLEKGDPNFYYETIEISKRLLHVQKHCRECDERNVIPDIWECLKFLGFKCEKAGKIVMALVELLEQKPSKASRYEDARQQLHFLFMCFGQIGLFNWWESWQDIKTAPTGRDKNGRRIYIKVKSHDGHVQRVTGIEKGGYRIWVHNVVENPNGSIRYTCFPDAALWMPIKSYK